MVDIEGGEIDLLASGLPSHVRAVCVETHPAAVGAGRVQDMLMRLGQDGFLIDLMRSRSGVAFLSRDAERQAAF
jgi:hypothetical protein